ncbi:MAG: helix-turn-helix domain-containing protein [Gammaproteobacteria bacterium]|nr:helix-turn-helix domain-containing protein [Gammaproteobacteria bacterium]
MDIGTRIRQARIAAGLSQARLAELLGVTRSACSQWESPQGTVPRGTRLAELAGLLGVSYEWLAMGSHGDSSYTGTDGPSDQRGGLNARQKELLRLYDQLPASGQAALMKFLHAFEHGATAASATKPAAKSTRRGHNQS